MATTLVPQLLTVTLPEVHLGGQLLRAVRLCGYWHGQPLGTAPVVLPVGGITASPFPFGDGEHPGWWPALDTADLVDPTQHTILCPCWPGNGTSWTALQGEVPAVVANLPLLSALDLADLVALWLDGIGCKRPVWYIGASMGALVGIALAVRHPARVERLVSISAGLRPDGWGTATRHLQRELVRDGVRRGDVYTGMVRARQLGMLTYRGRQELDTRFGTLSQDLLHPPVAGYLDHHGRKFAEHFPAPTFLLLSEAIDRCQLADTPEALRQALQQVTAEVAVIGVPGDLLFPYALQTELHRALQAAGGHSSLWQLQSEYGHDAFLADQDKLAELLRQTGFLAADRAPQPPRYVGVGTKPPRKMGLALVGCGTVGQGLLHLLDAQRQHLLEREQVAFEVVAIGVRDVAKARGPLTAGIRLTTDLLEMVTDPRVDAVVEVAGGEGDVADAVRAALAAGKPVVTANKALLSRQLAELATLAQRTETPLLCEAAAAAAIPVLRHLTRRSDEVQSLLAILNGTSNFALTRLAQDGWPISRAIAEAVRQGLAEANPDDDLSGRDAAAKLSILAYRSFGAWFRPDSFAVRGLDGVTAMDCQLAERLGYRIRHAARAERLRLADGTPALDLAVEPLLLPAWHLLASVEEEYNAVYLQTDHAGDLALFGKGAGGLPAATALLSDLLDLAQDSRARWPLPQPMAAFDPAQRLWRRYVRLNAAAPLAVDSQLQAVTAAGFHVLAQTEQSSAGTDHLAVVLAACTDAAVAVLLATLQLHHSQGAMLQLRVL